MAKVKQLPAKLSLECIAGDPLTVTVTSTGATITLPTVTLVDRSGAVLTDDPGTPAVSQDSAVTTVAFSGADTLALAAYRGVLRWSLSATVDGGGPYEIIADTLTIRPVGTAGVATESTAEMAVTVDGAAVALTVALGGTGGGGAVDSVNGATGVVVLDADDIDDTSTTNKFATAAELSKLAGIEAGATDDSTVDAHISDTTDAHDASAISLLDTAGNYTAADVEGALAELPAQYQPLDSDLTAIAALSTTSYGRAFLALADAAAARTALALGTGATATIADYLPKVAGGASVENIGAVESNVQTVAATGAAETLDTATYGVFDMTMDQACEFTFSNPAPSGKATTFVLILRGAFTPTLPSSIDWADASAPTYTTPSIYTFTTVDGGTIWLGAQVGKAFG